MLPSQNLLHHFSEASISCVTSMSHLLNSVWKASADMRWWLDWRNSSFSNSLWHISNFVRTLLYRFTVHSWCKPPRKVSYKCTFGAPDQVQMLDVWESQTTESALRWRAPYRSTSYSWSCSWSYSWIYSWTHVLGIKTMASLILDHVAMDYLYLGTNTERKICSWNCPMTRSW